MEDQLQVFVNERMKLGNQMNILMDLMKIPKEERNFEELKNKIEKMIEENDTLPAEVENILKFPLHMDYLVLF